MTESAEPIGHDVVLARNVFDVKIKGLGIQFPSLDLVLGACVHEGQVGMVGPKSEMDIPK